MANYRHLTRVGLFSIFLASCSLTGEGERKVSKASLIVTPPANYSTLKARNLAHKYKDNLERLVVDVTRNPTTGKLQFANNIVSAGGIGFFTHSAATSADERYLELILSVPEVFEQKTELTQKIDRVFSLYGAEVLKILLTDSAIYKDSDIAGYGLNFFWRSTTLSDTGPRVVFERTVLYFRKDDARKLLDQRLAKEGFLSGAIIFAMRGDGPAQQVVYAASAAASSSAAPPPQEKPSEVAAALTSGVKEKDILAEKEKLEEKEVKASPKPPPKNAGVAKAPNDAARKEPPARKTVEQSDQPVKNLTESPTRAGQEKTDTSRAQGPEREAPPVKGGTEATGLTPSADVETKTAKSAPVMDREKAVTPQAREKTAQSPSAKSATKDVAANKAPSDMTPQVAKSDPEVKKSTEKADGPKSETMPEPVAGKQAPAEVKQPPSGTTKSGAGMAPQVQGPAKTEAKGSESASSVKETVKEKSGRTAEANVETKSVEPKAVIEKKPQPEGQIRQQPSATTSAAPSPAKEAMQEAPKSPTKSSETGLPVKEVKEKSKGVAEATAETKAAEAKRVKEQTPQSESQTQATAKPVDPKSKEGLNEIRQQPSATTSAAPGPAKEAMQEAPKSPTKSSETGLPVKEVKEKSKGVAEATAETKAAEAKRVKEQTPQSESQTEATAKPSEGPRQKVTSPSTPEVIQEATLRRELPKETKPAVPHTSKGPSAPTDGKQKSEQTAPSKLDSGASVKGGAGDRPESAVSETKSRQPDSRETNENASQSSKEIQVSLKSVEGYVVQVAFPQKADALRWSDILAREGYTTSITSIGEAESVRLRVGSFTSPEAAKSLVGRLRKQGLNGFVVHVPKG